MNQSFGSQINLEMWHFKKSSNEVKGEKSYATLISCSASILQKCGSLFPSLSMLPLHCQALWSTAYKRRPAIAGSKVIAWIFLLS